MQQKYLSGVLEYLLQEKRFMHDGGGELPVLETSFWLVKTFDVCRTASAAAAGAANSLFLRPKAT